MKGLSKFLSMTLIAQGVAAVTGLLLARWLTVEDYAIYTVMIMIAGAMMVLTKGGVNLGLNAVLGRVWPDLGLAKGALVYSLKVRRIVSIISLPVVLIFSTWLLSANGATGWLLVSMLLLLCLNFYFDFHSRLYDQIANFANQAHRVQLIDAIASLLRLVMIALLHISSTLSVTLSIFIGVLATGLRVIPIRRMVSSILAKKTVDIGREGKSRISRVTKRQFPLEVFYVLQGQIVLVIVAFYGVVSDTAVLGALWRIGQLYLPINAIVNAYAIPRFSQLDDDKVLISLLKWGGFLLFPGVLLCVVALFYPQVLLFLIGDNYSGYEKELVLTCIFFALSSFSSSVWQLLANRGLNKFAYIQVPCFIIWCVLSPLFFLDLNVFSDVVLFQLGFPLSLLLTALYELYRAEIRKTTAM